MTSLLFSHRSSESRSNLFLSTVVLLPFCLIGVAVAGNLFVSPDIYKVGAGATGIAVGDFNKDGKPDLVTANARGSSVSVLLGSSNGKFKNATAYKTGTNPYAVAVADFNQDGKADVVTANSGSSSVSVLLGNGDGTFRKPVNSVVPGNPRSVAVGDFNGDGVMDVVSGDYRSYQVSILLGHGDGTFDAPNNIDLFGVVAVTVGDFNSDGKLDLAVAGGTSVHILLGLGNGSFQVPVEYKNFFAESLTVGDFNEDGHPDLAMGGYSSSVGILLGSADGTFHAGPTISVGTYPVPIVATNLNHDRHMDLAVVDVAYNTLYCLVGNGDATFQVPVDYAVDYLATGIVAADFNGDQKTDLATVGIFGAKNNVDVMLGNGNGVVRGERTYVTGLGVSDIAAADFNNDGKVDLIVPASYNSIATHTLLNAGNVIFTDVVNPILLSQVTTGDYNRDGKMDMAGTRYPNFDVWLGNGDGTFAQGASSVVGSDTMQLISDDFNRDGKLDIAISKYYGGVVGVLLGNGDGTFQPEVDFSTGGAWDLTSGDFNRDGIPDLAFSIPYSNSINVLLGVGDGTFRPGISYPAGVQPFWIVAGDLNHDGISDLVVSDIQDGPLNYISVLLGKNDGSFQPSVQYGNLNDPEKLETDSLTWPYQLTQPPILIRNYRYFLARVTAPCNHHQRSIPSQRRPTSASGRISTEMARRI